MKRLFDHWPAAASALLFSLAFPPANLSLLVFVALVPWLVFLRDQDRKRMFASGMIFGLLAFGYQMFWLFQFVTKWTGNPLMGALPWVIASVLMSLFTGLAAVLMHNAFRLKWWFLVPLIWAGVEGFRAFIPGLAFPWAFLAHPLWVFPSLVQMASFGGIFLVSAWLVLGNLVVIMLLFPAAGETMDDKGRGRIVLRSVTLFLALMLVGFARVALPPETTLRVFSLGQTGVDMAFSDRATRPQVVGEAGLESLAKATIQQPDLLVFPEGFAGPFSDLPPRTVLGDAPPVPVLFGAIRTEGQETYQSAYAWDRRWQFADKTRLVVFGEYVPFRDQLPFLQAFDLPSGDLTPGKKLETLTVNGMKIGALICFEGVFPELTEQQGRQGAQVLVQMSIDDWYQGTAGYDQLWQSSVWRSIESGLPLVRVGSLGQTLTTDSRGRVQTFVKPNERSTTRAEVYVPVGQSDAFPYRTAFVFLCWVAIIGVFARVLGEKWGKKKGQDDPGASSTQ